MSDVPPLPQPQQIPNYQPQYGPTEPETSKLAIAAFICGSAFCVPVLTPMAAVVLGIIALIVIASSNGRTKGNGFAITGILLGLIVGVGQIWLSFEGGKMLTGLVVDPARRVLVALETGDVDTARTFIDGTVQSQVTDAQLVAFQSKLAKKGGKFVDISLDIYSTGIAASPNFKGVATNLNFAPNAVQTHPVELQYEGATYFGAVDLRPNAAATSIRGAMTVANISVIVNGNTIHLIPLPTDGDDDETDDAADAPSDAADENA